MSVWQDVAAAMTCVKRRFRDEIAAKLALARIEKGADVREKAPRRAYRCPACHGWHLTSRGKPT